MGVAEFGSIARSHQDNTDAVLSEFSPLLVELALVDPCGEKGLAFHALGLVDKQIVLPTRLLRDVEGALDKLVDVRRTITLRYGGSRGRERKVTH